jgi:hypothetical protein
LDDGWCWLSQQAENFSFSFGSLNVGLERHRQREPKDGAARLMLVGPRSSAMGLDDGAANRKANPHSDGLRGHKGLENQLAILRSDARPLVAYRDEQALRRAQFRADHQFASVVIGAGHGLYRVHDQIQHDLLQLNSISLNQWQPLRQPRLY